MTAAAGQRAFDTAVIGAGPVGCVTALAFARRGARVLLLEAHPQASMRLAGEWLHPAGARVLDRLGVGSIPAATAHLGGRGFVIFPDDGAAPIVLEYPGRSMGLTCDHSALVSTLREAAGTHPNVTFVPFAHATQVEGGHLTYERKDHGGAATVTADCIVGADGRSSLVRKWLGLRDDRAFVSSTAGLVLDGVELPFEGFGHLLLSAPGPAFIYRIGPRHLRACLDVPSRARRGQDGAQYLWDAYRSVLPEGLRPAFRRALETRAIAWAANRFRPRSSYGREGLVLVGDAVGHFHPLTAVGLTLGFLDGECLARSRSFEAYRRERAAESHVPELMAMALYEVFALPDEGARALRRATYRLLRGDPAERQRTMRLLAAEETDVLGFSRPFLKAVALATERTVRETGSTRHGLTGLRILVYLHRRLAWLATHALIRVLRPSGHPGTARLSEFLGTLARRAAPIGVPGATDALQPLLAEALSRPPSPAAVPAGMSETRR